ncbi:group II intron reverse transcriptase/maturase [Holdemania massiliensis]|uniref:group II intron reverse transcriptase/maturase n=1 Tax=Holdemania massiliensis TaxID=1468449 RepID=UPI001F06A3A3|nr:group II intron reverse transcriptase/maturase [Holdemania massiliensis]MCH1939148.1 group II intron reverse transcriptase/maturase [Holdemania massiliensis]MCH1941364.1 group II intron reverse transcriptase/maturase [Holdemania massiliensis]MCH1941377.1 group II intron reverse transcriptase/maturase [Holdemania massiliensis]MCH1941795.1 group II intron reverse transcriptase/maturase [Holdemania massiliensis]MCH1942396.1 group II intron reverse transcriptase/maturase [Holdemania massiliensi
MKLMEKILSEENLQKAIKKVKQNKGAPGMDKMTVQEVEQGFGQYQEEIVSLIMNKQYRPMPVKRVYIPKPNGKQRPLGIPTVVDRVIQQAILQELTKIYEPIFSEHSFGFRPRRSAHMAMEEVLNNLNDEYEWIVDLDIEKFFDTVNHDKLISILRENVNDATTLHLIRAYLRAGVLEDGLVKSTTVGTPQGGPISVILSNIYLDKLDKELESRNLKFVRYADDCMIFVKSEMSANRVMKSVTSWLERKLFLKVSATKTKVVRPTKGQFLGFTFYKNGQDWKCVPTKDRKKRLYSKIKTLMKRKHAISRPLAVTFAKVNQTVRGWINYFKIGSIKMFLDEFGQWLRHKVRCIIIKQWKKPKTIYRNLMKLNIVSKCKFSEEDIYKCANTRLGWYKRSGMNIVNFTLSPKVLGIKKGDRPGLVNPLEYYLKSL